jgi:uncharacterized membrane protein
VKPAQPRGPVQHAWARASGHLRARPRLIGAVALGLCLAAVLPRELRTVTRALLGWNLAVWLYLALDGWIMLRADHAGLRRRAALIAESASTVLIVVVAISKSLKRYRS